MRKNSIFVWEFTQAPTALDFMQGEQFPEDYKDELFAALFGAAYHRGTSEKGKKIVKIKLNEEGTAVLSYDHLVIYKGECAASPCGLDFGPDGLYFTDLHGETNGKGRVAGGNIYRVRHK